MVYDGDLAYGIDLYKSRGRDIVFQPAADSYRLSCFSLKKEPAPKPSPKSKKNKSKGPRPVWQQRVLIRMTALAKTGDVIFAAGSPDTVDEDDPHAAWEGRKGGVLAAFSASDGTKLAEYKLDAPPTWDGLAAANGKLFIARQDGNVCCYK